MPVRDADRTTPARGARERRLRARLEHEHAAALRLQRSLLPERVDTTRLRVAVSYAPTARGSEVGGDWYDVFAVSGTAKTGLVIGDVAGHGLAEAAVMAQLRSVVRACSLEVGARPDRMADRLDGYVEAFLPEEMATMAYAVHDPDAARLCYCIAGHVPPILLRADGRCEPLPGRPDPPLGCALGMRHRRRWKRTAPGDLLVLYTDGVVERRGASIDQGVDALTGLLRSLGDGGETEPSEVCSAVMEWSDEGGRADDRAVLVAEL
ncbi:PP2C family protein-serine/threonine phosphatase [Nocardiopsis composta]